MVKKKILICDDELGVRESLKLILDEEYDLRICTTGEECMKILDAEPTIKVALVDIKMPKQDGLELTQQIKDAHPQVKVAIITGYSSTEIAQQATEAGADDYIVKPFDSADLRKKIASYIT